MEGDEDGERADGQIPSESIFAGDYFDQRLLIVRSSRVEAQRWRKRFRDTHRGQHTLRGSGGASGD